MSRSKQVRETDRQVDRGWALGLFLAAVVLFGVSLGSLPLRDWDEAIVAQVAREIWRASPDSLTWLHPTLDGAPYLNKPPLVHWFIAIAYQLGGVNEWTTRLPCALLTAISVPILYTIARELFPKRSPAILAALIYLTLLPVVRHGRLAMLDGPVLCFFLILVWCVLRSRRDMRYALAMGISFGAIAMTKGILSLLLGAIVVLFLVWDTPRLLKSGYVGLGVFLGSTPAIAWYGAQWQHYGQQFAQTHLLDQSIDRVWDAVEAHSGPPWYYLLELLKYAWPWLLFALPGLRRIWGDRNLGASKLILVWWGVYLLAISLMGTKLPWYVLPIYPAFALAGGVQLAEIWQSSAVTRMPQVPIEPYPRFWSFGLALLALLGWGATSYFSLSPASGGVHVSLTLLAISVTMTFATVLVFQKDAQFIPILFWGMYVSLLLFVTSDAWIWELNEDYPVQPVAQMIQAQTLPGQVIYTSHPYNRPSLNFYSDRQVKPADNDQLQKYWNEEQQPYFLLESSRLPQFELEGMKSLEKSEGWQLIQRHRSKQLKIKN